MGLGIAVGFRHLPHGGPLRAASSLLVIAACIFRFFYFGFAAGTVPGATLGTTAAETSAAETTAARAI